MSWSNCKIFPVSPSGCHGPAGPAAPWISGGAGSQPGGSAEDASMECCCVVCSLSFLPHSLLSPVTTFCFAGPSWDLQTLCCFSSRRVSGTARASDCRYPMDIKWLLHSDRGSRHQQEVFYQITNQGGSTLLWSQTSFRSYCPRVACLSPTMQEMKEYCWIRTI